MKKLLLLFLVLLIAEANSLAQSLPTVTSDSIINITGTTLDFYGNITNNGNDTQTRGRFCYSTSPNPIIDNTKNNIVIYCPPCSSTGSFHGTISGLIPNTTYYLRAYATNATGISYGNQLQITTGNVTLPSIQTLSPSDITATSANSVYKLNSTGNDGGVMAGSCYNTSPNPTITDSITKPANAGTVYQYANCLFVLTPNTTYYVKAYATNSAGTTYGSQTQFTTGSSSLATLTVDSIREITATTAKLYTNVSNVGNDSKMSRGVCYGTSQNPTVLANQYSLASSSDGHCSGPIMTGSQYQYISDLIPNTIYYVRAYAINSAGTSYGNQIQFTTGTATLPTIITDSINNITAVGARVIITISDVGNDPKANFGICYNIFPNPTILDSVVSGSQGFTTGPFYGYIPISSFWLELSKLSPNTTYYVRAYATTPAGTSYGSQLQFTTGSCYAYYTTTYDTILNTFTLTVDPTTSALTNSYYWDFGDGSSSTLAAPTHIYTIDSIFNVCLKTKTSSNDSCSYCSWIGKDTFGNIYRTSGFTLKVLNLQTGTTSISTNENSFTVYPNPTSGIFNLLLNRVENSQIKIYNVNAECIYQNINTYSNISIDLSNQVNGLYFIQLKTDHRTENKKIVISK